MGHAAHFLRRLDRVSDGQVELALTLYRDEALLKEVLSRAEIPQSAERLAISLADPVEGPFVVVTREGRFVTCLGEGMRASDLPVVTRERLDAAAARVQRMRDELDRVRSLRESGADGQAALAFRRMQQQGPRFAREDARILLHVQPLIESECLRLLIDLQDTTLEHAPSLALLRLDAPRKLRPAQVDYLLAFGDAVWSIAHLLVLVASDKVRGRLAQLDKAQPDQPSLVYALSTLAFEWGTCLHTARALWFLARGGKRALAAVKAEKRRLTLAHRLFRELGLVSLALGSEKLRAEALKALVTEPKHEEGWDDFDRALADTAAGTSKLALDVLDAPAPFQEHYLRVSRQFAAGLALGGGGATPTDAQCAAVPEDVARIAWVATPISLHDVNAVQMHTLTVMGLPALIPAAAEELFLPAEWAQRIVPPRGVEDVAYWLSKYCKANVLTPQRRPREAKDKVGRNDPCPCGSGKKHKRCCGATTPNG